MSSWDPLSGGSKLCSTTLPFTILCVFSRFVYYQGAHECESCLAVSLPAAIDIWEKSYLNLKGMRCYSGHGKSSFSCRCTCHREVHQHLAKSGRLQGRESTKQDWVLSCLFLLSSAKERKSLCRVRQQLQNSGWKPTAQFHPPPYTPRNLSCWRPAAAAEALRSHSVKNLLLERSQHRLAWGWAGSHRSESYRSCPALSHRALQIHRGSKG